MNLDKNNKFEMLYNIKLTELYEFVIDVMRDFGYSLIRTVKDHEMRRRIEIWGYQSREEQSALVWVEVVKMDETLDQYMTTDVLRTMNDENVTRLFFFTNSDINASERSVLEGTDHYIFSRNDIVETLTLLETRRVTKVNKKRKKVKSPSAITLIKNYLKVNSDKRKETKLKTSAAPELASQYVKLVRRVLNEIDKIPDLNDLQPQTREKLKHIQYELLPELIKTPGYMFTRQFSHLRNSLFTLIEYAIVYLGNVIEYESEEDMKNNRDVIEEILDKLSGVEKQVLDYNSGVIFSTEKSSLKIIIISGVISFVSILILIVLKFS